jgi:hypothetical protein
LSNVQRHRREANNPVEAAVDLATAIEIGDMVWQDSDDAKPASDVAEASTLAETQEAFHDGFLGVSEQASRATLESNDIRVGTTGVWEFTCDAATFELGALVGPAAGAGAAIVDQKVAAVATPNLAIGRVAKRYGSNTTKVFVRISSVVMSGGPQAAA